MGNGKFTRRTFIKGAGVMTATAASGIRFSGGIVRLLKVAAYGKK